jgi:hypothetical protein
MSEKEPVPGLRSLLEDTFGLKIDDAMRKRIEAGFGTTLDDDPSRWDDVKRTLAIQAGEDPEAEGIVAGVVDRLRAEVGDRSEPPAPWTEAERAVFATVRVEEAVEEGGFDNIEPTGARPWLVHAIEGYRLLGLDEHARIADRVATMLATGAGSTGDEREDLEEDWFGTIGSDQERAAWITAHPDQFRS